MSSVAVRVGEWPNRDLVQRQIAAINPADFPLLTAIGNSKGVWRMGMFRTYDPVDRLGKSFCESVNRDMAQAQHEWRMDQPERDLIQRSTAPAWQEREAREMAMMFGTDLKIDGHVLKPGDMAEFKTQSMTWRWTGSELVRETGKATGPQVEVKQSVTANGFKEFVEGKMETTEFRRVFLMGVVDLTTDSVQDVAVVATSREDAILAAAVKAGVAETSKLRSTEIVVLREAALVKTVPATGGAVNATPTDQGV